MRQCFISILAVLLLLAFQSPSDWKTPFEKSSGKASATYDECMNFYRQLDETYDEVNLIKTDTQNFFGRGRSLYHITAKPERSSSPKVRIFINNAIHAGEPDGVDACMLLLRDLLQNEDKKELLKELEIFVIPVYNADGFNTRGCCSRANQEGPEEYGFRANGLNYDLNRDFIKCDAAETEFFQEAFQHAAPHIFIDTHVSNGADYQYVMTCIAAHKAKLHPAISATLHGNILPQLEKRFSKRGPGLAPYVNVFGSVPDSGYNAFFESPRYASGYASLFNCMGFVTETHMLKAFKQRVEATYDFLLDMIQIANSEKNNILIAKSRADSEILKQDKFSITWKHDPNEYRMLNFKGYAAGYKKSAVSGADRLFYDRTKPFEKKIKYFDTYLPSVQVETPKYYVIPAAYRRILEPHLIRNRVSFRELTRDSTLGALTAYWIENYQSSTKPYEGHYLHYNVAVKKQRANIKLQKGSLIISTEQAARRYLIETLEPEATDAFFAWNFFDAILQQKEHYSDYVWEDRAAELLANDDIFKEEFNRKKNSDSAFARNPHAQLDWIYKESNYAEPGFMRYPVYRIEY